MLTGLGALGVHLVPWTGGAQEEVLKAEAAGMEAPFLLRHYCGSCHSSGRSGMDIEGPLDLAYLRRNRPMWEKAVASLRGGHMPPRGRPQPTPAEREYLVSWIEHGVLHAEPVQPGAMLVRRLRRGEYLNAIRDLLGFRPACSEAIPDATTWSRVQAAPALPQALLDKYRVAAEGILELARAKGLLPVAGPIRKTLAAFGRHAYHRPLQTGELDGLVAAYNGAHRTGLDQEQCIAAALEIVLTSPHFLYIVEKPYDPDEPEASQDSGELALAVRLAFFLWSSIPDDELLVQAEHGVLGENLAWNVERMLHDPRSNALAKRFAAYWLELPKRAQLGNGTLPQAMRQETDHFVAHIVQEDRSVLEFLDADYTFVNERLARHYGIPNIRGEHMQRVSLTATPRRGLLTQGSILTLTSNGISTSPVRRGKWVLDNLLATPPPPPPRALLAKSKLLFEPGTARQQLEQHRADPSCFSCHVKMDPIGFALENFDATGGWRTHEFGRPIDVKVTTSDGESLSGAAGLQAYLRKHQDQFVRCLGEKLLSYALGRKLEDRERAFLEHLPEVVKDDQYRFSRLLLEVVKSPPFRAGGTN